MLFRSRRGLAVAVVDVPSDRQGLVGFRQTRDHVTDIKAVIAWLRQETKLPVWLVGTSRGTQSAAYIAIQLPPDAGGPDGVVLTSSMLLDKREWPVPNMSLDRISVPVLVVHHKQDGCRATLASDLSRLTNQLKHLKRTETLLFEGGKDEGDACEAFAHHGYNGIEADVVEKIAEWILKP